MTSGTATRRGERLGWTLGWLGGFAWVAVLAGVFAFQGRWLEALAGAVVFVLGVLAILGNAPWRYPDRPYWRLMWPLYGLMGLSIVWAFWSFEDASAESFSAWQLLWVVPLLLPLVHVGARTWNKGETHALSQGTRRNNGEHD